MRRSMAVSASAEWTAILQETRKERALELVLEQKKLQSEVLKKLPAQTCLSLSLSLYLKTEAMEPL